MNQDQTHSVSNHAQSAIQLLQVALAHHQNGSLKQAEDIYAQILKLNPHDFDCLHLTGVIFYQTQRLQGALRLIDQAIAVNPAVATAYNNRGLVLQALQCPEAAIASYDRAIALDPDYAQAHLNRGNALQDLQRFEQALSSYQESIRLQPLYAEAFYNRGNIFKQLKRLPDALESYNSALTVRPDYAEALSNRGIILFELKDYQASLDSFDRAIVLKPDYVEAYSNRAGLLNALEDHEAAVFSCEQALALNPDFADAHANLGVALTELGYFERALSSFAQAIRLRPVFAQAYSNQGNAFKKLNRLTSALASYDQALLLGANEVRLYLNRGIVLKELGRLNEALDSFDRAGAVTSDRFETEYCRGAVLKELKRFDEALASYDKAIAIKPDYPYLAGTRLHVKMQVCDWTDFQAKSNVLNAGISESKQVILPFPLLALNDSLSVQQRVATSWTESQAPVRDDLGEIPKRSAGNKIRLGYYSADFHQHATAYLMAEFFECHDKHTFELIAFSFGMDRPDQMRRRLHAAFDQFIDVRHLSDLEVARLSREMRIDIAIDLKGFTAECRTGIFAYRAAPVQVSYLGYPGTMGATYIDYIIADQTVISPENRMYYSEKVAYLPDCYQVNDSHRKISPKMWSRKELGLPEKGFVFCCFNNNFKITPATFEGWMRILQQVEHSVLWLLADSATVIIHLRQQAERCGVKPDRLIFGERLDLDLHLARHRQADLFLDTFPCNAHTTASDALWSGLPLLTRRGESFAACVAASLLQAVGLPELVADTQLAYESMAIELATQGDQLATYRKRLTAVRDTAPLFNAPRTAEHIEEIYSQMYQRYQLDLLPDHIFIPGSRVQH